VAEALAAFWNNFWPESVTVGAEGVKVFVGYSLPPEPIREARSGNADQAVPHMRPWVEGSRLAPRPFQLNLTAWPAEGDPSTLAPVKVTPREAALLPIVAHCFMPAPKQPSSLDERELLAVEMRWRKGQSQPFAIDIEALRAPVTDERKSAILACMKTALAGQIGFAGPARRLRLQYRPLPIVQRTCLTAPPEDGVSEIIALTPHSNLPDLVLDDASASRSAAWKERRTCLETATRRPWPKSAGAVTQTFVPVASASAISQDFKPSMDQATTSVGKCFKRVDLPDGQTSVHASWPIGAGGRLGSGHLTSEERLPSNSIRCLRRAIGRLSLPPVPQTTGTFRLEFRVFTRSVRAPTPSCSPPELAAEASGPLPDWALELMRKRPPRDSLLLVLPYALIATPLPVLPVEPPPLPPAAPTRVGSGRPPPESFGFTPPSRAELDAMQRCLDSCVANNRWSEIGSKALSSAVVEVYPWCDEPPELGTIDCVPPSLAELGPSCAKQCLRRANVAGSLFLGAHPDDFVQPEPPPLLALVFDGSKGDPRGLVKQAVAAQPAVQRCFLDAAEEEAVPDWVNLRIKFEVDGRVASVTGWGGRGSDELIGCLARVAAKWDTLKPLRGYAESSRSLLLFSLRRDPRAVGLAGWEMGVRRGIRFESLDALESSTSARLLAGFKRYTFGLVGLEEHSSAILRASFALLPAFLLFRALRRRRARRALRADSQSD